MRPTHLLSDGRILMRIFSLVLSVNPQRFWPHASTRTLPLFSSVAHRPIGVASAATAAAATGAGCDTVGVGAAAGGGAAGADRVLNPTPGMEAGGGTVLETGA